ncbi:MAG: hypothetical protein IKN59_06085, partial [Paludibacteraceae bacterium]|nr:hypothetical protein [Paludibacteraceae bacterium]
PPADYDYTSSMTAVVKVDLKAQYPVTGKDFVLNDSDLLAAFSGETCLGVAEPLSLEGHESPVGFYGCGPLARIPAAETLFFLYITGPSSLQGGEGGKLSLRYYSTHYKNLFEAKDAINFVNDAHLGTVAEPLVPSFVVVK